MNTITSIALLGAAAGGCLALPAYHAEFSEVRVLDAEPPKTETVYVVETEIEDEDNEHVVVDLRTGVSTNAEGDFFFTSAQPEQKHRVRIASPTGKVGHSYMVSSQDDDESYIIKIENGKVVQLKHNGDDVPDNRFTFDDGVIVIMGKNGKVLTEHNIHAFGVPTPPNAPDVSNVQRVMRFGQGGNFVFNKDDNVRFFTDNSGNQVTWDFKPRVMVGINQGVPGAALRYHLELKDDQPCILIEKVIEGLPAARAGLKRFDIVVRADGKNADDTVLRKILSEKNPGENVTFEVIRRGHPVEVVIELEEFDGEKLSPNVQFFSSDPNAPQGNVFITQPPTPTPGFPGGQWRVKTPDAPEAPHAVREFRFSPENFANPEKHEMIIKQLHEQIEILDGQVILDGDQLFISEDFPEIMGHIEMLSGNVKHEEVEVENLTRREARRFTEKGENVTRRAAPRSDERLERLEERLDRLEDSLSDRLERLFDRLDSISDQLQDVVSDSEEDQI